MFEDIYLRCSIYVNALYFNIAFTTVNNLLIQIDMVSIGFFSHFLQWLVDAGVPALPSANTVHLRVDKTEVDVSPTLRHLWCYRWSIRDSSAYRTVTGPLVDAEFAKCVVASCLYRLKGCKGRHHVDQLPI